MALDYAGSANLMTDVNFRNRVKVACLHFADYIMGEAADTPAHNTRVRWAQLTVVGPDNAAQQVTPPTVMDAKVQEAGADVTDADLQSAVEAAVSKML